MFINYIYLVELVKKFLEEENFFLHVLLLERYLALFPIKSQGNEWIKVMKVHHLANLHQFLYSELHVWESIDCSPPSIYLKNFTLDIFN